MTFPGLTASFGELVHAVDEGKHDGQQENDQRECRCGEQGDPPPNQQIANVVADGHLPDQQQYDNQEGEDAYDDIGSEREQLIGIKIHWFSPGQ